MAQTFSAQVDKWVKSSAERAEAVVKTAAQDLYNESRVTTAKGGNMPVDTGYLRNSAMASVDSFPQVGDEVQVQDNEVITTIAGMKVGEKLMIGFTANYAPHMENRFGFVRLTAMRWQEFVNSAIRKLKK